MNEKQKRNDKLFQVHITLRILFSLLEKMHEWVVTSSSTKKKTTTKASSAKKLKSEIKTEGEEEIIKTTKKTAKATKTPSRASNDPRKKPKPVKSVEIETVIIETSKAKPLDASDLSIMPSTSKKIARPANDPRGKK